MLTPLMYASWKGQIGIVRELLDMGADVNGSVTGGVHDSRSAVSAALERSVFVIAVMITVSVMLILVGCVSYHSSSFFLSLSLSFFLFFLFFFFSSFV